jgi:hypothetical protein
MRKPSHSSARLISVVCFVLATAPLACRKAEESGSHKPNRVSVESSALESVGYDDESRTLAIEFENGAVYHYFEVPSAVHRGLLDADSHGRYFHQHIRGADYKYERVR